MATLRLQTEVENPVSGFPGSECTLRIYASTSFYSAEGEQITGSQVGSNTFYKSVTCTISSGLITIPQLDLATTSDSSQPLARYTAVFYDENGRKRNTKLSQFFVVPDFLQQPAYSSVEVSDGGTAAGNGIYTYRGQSNGKGYYNLNTYSDSTSNRVIVWTGSQWRINSSAGARYYYSAEDVDYPWQVVTWTADTGSAPVPAVEEYTVLVTSTWQELIMSNQGVGIVPPGYWQNGPFWSSAQTIQYINDLVGDGTTPYASSLRAGKTYLSYDPNPSTNPIAIGQDDPDWIAITEQVVWLSGREYENDFAAAVAGIGATPKTLIITESTNVTATVSTPTTLHLQFESGGKLNISSGQTVTIGSMNPCGSQQIFTGAGNAVFAKNATSGQFNLSWWSGISDSSSDLTTDFAQAATSLTNNTGGTLFIGPGVWKMDGMTVPSGSWIVGAGQNTNITGGTVIKPYSTSAVDLFTFSGGFKRSGIKNLTLTTDGTVSSSSRCIRVLGNATSAFGLTIDEVHVAATLASSILINFDDVASNNYELVDILINHLIAEVPENGTALKWESNNTLTTLIQPSIICETGATCYHVGQASGGGGWIDCISGDERGLQSNASTQPTNRTITGSIDGVTGVLTLTSGAYVQNDVGQPFTRGAATGYITDLLTSTTANTSYRGVPVANGSLTMQRFVPSTLMASCVWRIVGDHNTINIIGGADEGFQYFLINDAPTNVAPINVSGRTIQATVSLDDPCVLTFRNCALRSQTFTDAALVTASLFFDGCSWDTTTINLNGVPDSTTTTPVVITNPRIFGVHDGASIVYTDLSFHEGLQSQSIEVQTEFLDRRDGAVTPLAVFASASNADQPAIRVGRFNEFTWEVDHYYDIFRDAAVDGWLEFNGSQAAPFRGYRFDANVQTESATFVGGQVSPSQITASQNNYNPGNSSYFTRLSANGSYNITGLGLTTTQRGGEIHSFVLLDNVSLTWKNQNTGSTAGNRFQTDSNGDIIQRRYEIVDVTYDSTTQRWRLSKRNITGLTSNGATISATLPISGTSLQLASSLEVGGTTALNDAVTIDSTLEVTAGATLSSGADLTFSGTTGQSKILLTDNLANALAVAEGSNDYIRWNTTNGSEQMNILKPLVSVSASAGIGFSTGSGGSVTQGTSRTTAVTLNTPSGAITLFSAAGSTSPASFTVNNSTVAATDTIQLSQKSGTDKYDLSVTAVGAGSFEITFNTKSGTTVEQPVINFTVLKGATS